MHQNIAGLISKSDELAICLDELKSDNNVNVDVICITEHNIRSSFENNFAMSNYQLATSFCRLDMSKGGACIIVRNGLEFKELPEIKSLSITGTFECCAIELILYKIVIVCIYRIPKNIHLDVFFTTLDSILQKLRKKQYKHIVIAGDYNINMLSPNSTTRRLENLLLSYNLELALKQPTRLSSQTCIGR